MPYKDPEKAKAQQKAYYEANADKLKAYQKAYRESNADKVKAGKKAHYEANADKIKAKKKAYYEANTDKVKAYQKTYREKNKEKIAARDKAYREKNKEKIAAEKKAYYEANADKIKAEKKAHYEANADKIKARQKVWRENNLELKNFLEQKRRALKIPALLPTTDDGLIKKLYKQRAEMSKKRGEEYHVDHIIPLSIGGAHHQDNMRVITAKENLEKRDKYIPELGGVWADNDLAREYKKKHNIK